MSKSYDVVVIGGGIAGAALGAMLDLHNEKHPDNPVSFVVFEKDKDFLERHQGYGLTMAPSYGGKALRELGTCLLSIIVNFF